jgi:hypothetical protein
MKVQKQCTRGAVKTFLTNATYICRSAKTKVVTYLFLFIDFFFKGVFRVFRNKRSSKTRNKKVSKKSIWAHHKKCGFISLRFFSPSLGCFVRFFFNRVFKRFVTRGVQKRDKENRAKISSASKKSTYLLTYVAFFCFCFRGAPWQCNNGLQRNRVEKLSQKNLQAIRNWFYFPVFYNHVFGRFSVGCGPAELKIKKMPRGAEVKKNKSDVYLADDKSGRYLFFFFSNVLFMAFLCVSQQGEFKNTTKNLLGKSKSKTFGRKS